MIELLEREGCARGSSGGGSEKRPDVWAAEPAGGRNLWEGGRGMWHASREHVTAPRGACWAGGWRLDVGRPTDDDGWQYAASWEEPPAAWRDRPAKGHRCRRRAWLRAVLPAAGGGNTCLLYTSPSPRDGLLSRMPSSA